MQALNLVLEQPCLLRIQTGVFCWQSPHGIFPICELKLMFIAVMHENSKLKHVECVKKYSNNWKKDNLLYFNNNFEYLFFPF